MRPALAALALLASACSLSPLQRKIKVGEDPFVTFLAEGSDGHTDLFAALPTGGTPVRLTFTRLVEALPRLSPSGDVVAFARERNDLPARDLVVLNLLNGAERLLELPEEHGAITAIGWSDDGSAIYVATGEQHWHVTAPPTPLVVTLLSDRGADSARTAFTTRLGTPVFATAAPCEDGGVCLTGPSGVPTRLAESGGAPFRWGSDSVAWFDADVLVVRPLAGGTARRVDWGPSVSGAREGSYASPVVSRES